MAVEIAQLKLIIDYWALVMGDAIVLTIPQAWCPISPYHYHAIGVVSHQPILLPYHRRVVSHQPTWTPVQMHTNAELQGLAGTRNIACEQQKYGVGGHKWVCAIFG